MPDRITTTDSTLSKKSIETIIDKLTGEEILNSLKFWASKKQPDVTEKVKGIESYISSRCLDALAQILRDYTEQLDRITDYEIELLTRLLVERYLKLADLLLNSHIDNYSDQIEYELEILSYIRKHLNEVRVPSNDLR
ncbi:MAG: hypothetical protein JNK26_03160 [Candidatus Doudnabacteria bacterium]|nr:hypothetical protein [Candidatus Doudnabacteria bacterium]